MRSLDSRFHGNDVRNRIRRERASVEQLAQRAADIAYRLFGTMFVFD